jgi:hypothetical protein
MPYNQRICYLFYLDGLFNDAIDVTDDHDW